MLKQETLRERLETLRDPLTLCHALSLTPTPAQRELLQRLALREPLVQVAGDDLYTVHRAVGIGLLWRLLSTPGASGIIVSPSKKLSADFMEFMKAVCTRINPGLAEVTSFPRWDHMKIGNEAGWELRAFAGKHPLLGEKAGYALVSVVLNARRTDLEFVEACQTLEQSIKHQQHSRIVVW